MLGNWCLWYKCKIPYFLILSLLRYSSSNWVVCPILLTLNINPLKTSLSGILLTLTAEIEWEQGSAVACCLWCRLKKQNALFCQRKTTQKHESAICWWQYKIVTQWMLTSKCLRYVVKLFGQSSWPWLRNDTDRHWVNFMLYVIHTALPLVSGPSCYEKIRKI